MKATGVRENSRCKGSEAGMELVCVRNTSKTTETELE